MTSTQRPARTAGLLYLLYLAAQIFAGVVRSNLFTSGEAATTASRILTSETLFRVDVVSDVLAAVLFLLSAWALYVLLKPVDQNIALLFLLLNLGGVAVQSVNMLNQFAALLVLNGADSLSGFQADQLQSLAQLFLTLHKNGFTLAQVFYGAWLLPLGYLVFKSGYLPKALGLLLVADFFGVLIWFFQFFLFPGYDVVTYPGFVVSFIAEFSLSLWLLIKGVNVEHQRKLALASA